MENCFLHSKVRATLWYNKKSRQSRKSLYSRRVRARLRFELLGIYKLIAWQVKMLLVNCSGLAGLAQHNIADCSIWDNLECRKRRDRGEE